MTKRVCLHCGVALTKPTQNRFCSREHFREFRKAGGASHGRICLHCHAPLNRFQKGFCSREHRTDYVRVRNATPTYTDIKCRHCGGFIPVALPGRIQNKLFCCAAHRGDHARLRRAEEARGRPFVPNKDPRYCEHPGCENTLSAKQKRFCCVDHTPRNGHPPKYTEEQADRIRELFFSGQLGLRETAVEVGVTLGTVARIIYEKSPGRKRVFVPRKKRGSYKKRLAA